MGLLEISRVTWQLWKSQCIGAWWCIYASVNWINMIGCSNGLSIWWQSIAWTNAGFSIGSQWGHFCKKKKQLSWRKCSWKYPPKNGIHSIQTQRSIWTNKAYFTYSENGMSISVWRKKVILSFQLLFLEIKWHKITNPCGPNLISDWLCRSPSNV